MTGGATPDLSVVVLTYNRSALLMQCLDSLLRDQEEPGAAYEVIVVDDGSTDDTRALTEDRSAGEPRLRYAPQPHLGISAARNRGIREARAPLVAIVADDYILPPEYVRAIVGFFRERPEARAVRFHVVAAADDLSSRASHFYYEISLLNRLQPEPHGRTAWNRFAFYFRRLPPPSMEITCSHDLEAAGAAAYRRDVFDEVGLFDENLQRGEDTDMRMRFKERGIDLYYVPYVYIRHQYRRGCVDTVRKSFLSGIHHYGLYAKHAADRPWACRAGSGLHFLARQFLSGLWRARQSGSLGRFFVYLPFMMTFELAVKAGFVCGALRARRSRWGMAVPARDRGPAPSSRTPR